MFDDFDNLVTDTDGGLPQGSGCFPQFLFIVVCVILYTILLIKFLGLVCGYSTIYVHLRRTITPH